MPDTADESVIYQFNKDLDKLESEEKILEESEQEYNEGLAEHEESEKAKQQMEEQEEEEREQEFLNQGDENV